MRSWSLLFALVPSLFGQNSTAVVEVKTVHAVTGEPVPHVRVKLQFGADDWLYGEAIPKVGSSFVT